MTSKISFPVEIPVLLCLYSQILADSIATNLYIYRTCYVILGFNKSDCALLGNKENEVTKTLETLVQPTVNHIDMAMSVCDSAIPVLMCMFVGTWSDKFGRKPFLILILTGTTLSTFLNAILVNFEYISPWYFVLTRVPATLTGGFSTTFIIFTLYIADSTTSENRVFRIGVYQAVMALASLVGTFSSSYLFYATSYEAVYTISTVLIGSSVLYIILLLPESLQVEKRVPTIMELVSMMNFLEIVNTAFKKRENKKRYYIVTIMGLLVGYNIVFRGDLALRSLFLRQKLQWTFTKVTLGSSYASVVYIFGTIFGTMFLYRKMKFEEKHLVILSIITQGTASLLRALATNDYYIYAGFISDGFSGLGSSMLRIILTYLVAPNELGKIYATSNALNNLFGVIASGCIYPLLYNATIQIDSGLFYYLDVGVFVLMLIVMLNLMRNPLPKSLDQAPEKENEETQDTKSEIIT